MPKIRIGNVDIRTNIIAAVALSDIYGIGRSLAMETLRKNNLENKKMSEYTDDELMRIKKHIEENYLIEGALKSHVMNNIKRLISMNCYKGDRHRRGLPVHGQRTKTNSRTRKGPKKTVANKKKAEK